MTMLSAETAGFLGRLRANNDRQWFEANKGDYEACVKRPGEAFAHALSDALEAAIAQSHDFRIFRIHRDVRFARDKTPYNAHLHISLSPSGSCKEGGPVWMFGLDPDGVTLGAGAFAFSPGQLANWRTLVAGAEGNNIARLLASLEVGGVRINTPELKRVPAPHAGDHIQGTLLRRKGLTAWIDNLDPEIAFGTEGPNQCTRRLLELRPIMELIARL